MLARGAPTVVKLRKSPFGPYTRMQFLTQVPDDWVNRTVPNLRVEVRSHTSRVPEVVLKCHPRSIRDNSNCRNTILKKNACLPDVRTSCLVWSSHEVLWSSAVGSKASLVARCRAQHGSFVLRSLASEWR
jgi:hypothetical protein